MEAKLQIWSFSVKCKLWGGAWSHLFSLENLGPHNRPRPASELAWVPTESGLLPPLVLLMAFFLLPEGPVLCVRSEMLRQTERQVFPQEAIEHRPGQKQLWREQDNYPAPRVFFDSFHLLPASFY